MAKTHKSITLPDHPKEADLHKSVAEFLRWALIPPTLFTTFPAGWGKLSKATAGRLYASGLARGMPDILIFACATSILAPRPRVLGIELKVGANSVTAAQREMFAKLQGVGIRVYVCRSIEDVADALKQEQIPCRLAISANGPQPKQTGQTGPAPLGIFRPPT